MTAPVVDLQTTAKRYALLKEVAQCILDMGDAPWMTAVEMRASWLGQLRLDDAAIWAAHQNVEQHQVA